MSNRPVSPAVFYLGFFGGFFIAWAIFFAVLLIDPYTFDKLWWWARHA
ncbi:hypothetical protein [Pseudoxanthomonas winnipegensis]|nr:hypothetical protein [Pseudoxanthomonas winnipegensis]